MHRKGRGSERVRRMGALTLAGLVCMGTLGSDSIPFWMATVYASEAGVRSKVDIPSENNSADGADAEASELPGEETSGEAEENTAETPEDSLGEDGKKEEQENTSGSSQTPDGTGELPSTDASSGKENVSSPEQTEENTSGGQEILDQNSPEEETSAEAVLTEEEQTALEEEKALAEEEEDDGEGNEELISRQTIIHLPQMEEDFRFWTVARVYGFAREELCFYEEKDLSSRKTGELRQNGLLYVLQEEKDGWYYAESGTVRGFVRAEQVMTQEEAEPLLSQYTARAKAVAARRSREYTGIEHAAAVAKPLLDITENQAYTYLRATVNQTVVERVYALCLGDKVNIREEQNTDSRIVGKMAKDSLCYVIADGDKDWVYVESGNVRGFIKKEYLQIADDTNHLAEQIESRGEDTYNTAVQTVDPSDNKALYYTMTSIRSGSQQSDTREKLLEYAAQFAGNPYRWGGSSLTDGTDCSGFTRAVYAAFGYHLPRTSQAQSQCGTKIAVEDARPGDLIFYAKKGRVYHVAIYAGDGRTIEAANEELGITSLNAFRKNAVWAVHLIADDTDTPLESGITEQNAEISADCQALGEYHITYYCPCGGCTEEVGTVTDTLTPLVEGYTVAVSASVAKEGSRLIIDGHLYTVTNREDLADKEAAIYVSCHEKTAEFEEKDTVLYVKSGE